MQPVKSESGLAVGKDVRKASVVGSAPARAAQSAPAVVKNGLAASQTSEDSEEFDFESGYIEKIEKGLEGESLIRARLPLLAALRLLWGWLMTLS